MKVHPPLFWHQGLFLQPQHFQLLEASLHSRLTPLLSCQTPHFWGVAHCEFDEAALGTGAFGVRGGSFLFPDGAYADVPGNAVIAPARFPRCLSEGKPLQVYLGLKKWHDAGSNVTVIDRPEDAADAATRFVTLSQPHEVRDLHACGPEAQVKRLFHLLKIFFEPELEKLADHLLIPLARIEQAGTTVRLSPSFAPPALTLKASKALFRLVKEIRDTVAARAHQLDQYKRQRGVHRAEFGSRDMVYLLAMRTLNRHVPHLFHLTETEAVHPWTVYGALRQLVGELSSFSLRVNALGEVEGGYRMLPPYDHKNLWHCFSAVQDLVTQLLDEITSGPDYLVRLESDGVYYAAALKPAMLQGLSRYYLAVSCQEDPQVVLRSLDSVAKLSAREHHPVLASRALPGIPLHFLQAPPQELPRRANTLYFAVDHHHDQWDLVAKEHNIALHWDDAPADLQVELMVVEKTQQ